MSAIWQERRSKCIIGHLLSRGMSKKLLIRIFSDGSIKATTEGIKGAKCTEYLDFFTNILKVNVLDSEFTNEYYEQDEVTIEKVKDIIL